ncbi:MAG: hypothetical protein BroJett030_19470 [Alphaproteobacteria bacterium]|nr:MAG: hypothetical protein BroJett030_19470 [Alphaproteobacteria bacterium]
MPLSIRSEAVNRLAQALADRKKVSKTEAVRIALENEMRRLEEQVSLWDRLKPLRDRVASYPLTGAKADRAFFDELSGDY